MEGGGKEMDERKPLHANGVADGRKKCLARDELSFCDFVGAGKVTVLQEVQDFFDNRPNSPLHWDRKVKVRSRRSLTRAKPGRMEGSEFQICFNADEKDDVSLDESSPVDEDCPVTGEIPFRRLSSGKRQKSSSLSVEKSATSIVAESVNDLCGERSCARQHDRDILPMPAMCEACCSGGLQRFESMVDLSRVVDMETLCVRQSIVEDSNRRRPRSQDLLDAPDDQMPLPQGLWNIYSGLCGSQRQAEAHCVRIGGADAADQREAREHAVNRTTLVRSLRAAFEDPEDNAIKNTSSDMLEAELVDNEAIHKKQKGSVQVEDNRAGIDWDQREMESWEHGESSGLRTIDQSATPEGEHRQERISFEVPVQVPDNFSLANGEARMEEAHTQVGKVTPNHDRGNEYAPSYILEQLCSVISRRKSGSERMEKRRDQDAPVISGKDAECHSPMRHEVAGDQNQMEIGENGPTTPDLGASGGLGLHAVVAGQGDRNAASVTSVPVGMLPDELVEGACAFPGRNGNTFSKDTLNPSNGNGKRKRKKAESRKSLVGAGSKWEHGRRRSTRVRVPPVEWWNNEKLLYGRVSDSLCTLVGIKKLLPPTPPVGRRQQERRQKFEIMSFVSPRWKNLVDFVAL